MSEANDGPGVEITVAVDAAPEGQGEGGASGEVGEAEALEPIAEAAVEIAQIEADRDVALAVIHNEGEAAWNEARANEELEQCRTTIARLEGELEALRNPPVVAVELIPEPSPEPPLSPPEAASESMEEGGPRESPVEPAEEPPAAEPPKPKRPRLRWI